MMYYYATGGIFRPGACLCNLQAPRCDRFGREKILKTAPTGNGSNGSNIR